MTATLPSLAQGNGYTQPPDPYRMSFLTRVFEKGRKGNSLSSQNLSPRMLPAQLLLQHGEVNSEQPSQTGKHDTENAELSAVWFHFN